MDNQGANFLSTAASSFGVQQASVISDETADLIFGGGSTAASPAAIEPIRRKKPKPTATIQNIEEEDEDPDNETQHNRDPFPTREKISTDELLDSLNNSEEDEEYENPEPQARIKPEPQQPQEPEEETDDTFLNLTKELIKAGVFQERDEDSTSPVTTPEAFKDRWIQEKQDQADKQIYDFILSKHGQEGMEMFDSIFVKGVNPKEYLSRYSEIQKFQDLDMTSEDNQKMVFRESLRRQGLPEDKIERKLQRVIDYGDLEEETKDLHEILVKQEREDLNDEIAAAEERAAQQTRMKQQYVNNMNVIIGEKLKAKEFDGIPVTDKVAKETYDYLTTEKWQLPSGERLTDFDKDLLELRDPKNHEIKVKLALLLRNKLDLSKIKNKQVSEQSNRVFDTLVRRDSQQRRANPKSTPASRGFLEGLQ